jgi:hypothetical protein
MFVLHLLWAWLLWLCLFVVFVIWRWRSGVGGLGGSEGDLVNRGFGFGNVDL